MDIQNIITELKTKFGSALDVDKVKDMLSGMDLKNTSMSEIIAKVKDGNFLGDLDGDGKQESMFEEIKGKAGKMFSGVFHH